MITRDDTRGEESDEGLGLLIPKIPVGHLVLPSAPGALSRKRFQVVLPAPPVRPVVSGVALCITRQLAHGGQFQHTARVYETHGVQLVAGTMAGPGPLSARNPLVPHLDFVAVDGAVDR